MSSLTQFQKDHRSTEITQDKIDQDNEARKNPANWRILQMGAGRPCHSCGSYQVTRVYVPIHRNPNNRDYIDESCFSIIRANWDNQKSPFPAQIIEQAQTPAPTPAPVKRSHKKKQAEGLAYD